MDQQADKKFLPILVNVVLRFPQVFDYPFYIKKPNGEFVEITINSNQLKRTMEGYLERGLKEIYLTEANLIDLTKKLRAILEQKNDISEAFKDMESIYLSLRSHLKKLGLNDLTLKLAEEINKAVIMQMGKVPSLSDLLVKFKKDCDAEFLKYVALSHVAISMTETFPWKSKQIQLKVGLASLLCDSILTPADFKTMNEVEFEKWPSELKNYPTRVTEAISRASAQMPIEVIQMVGMHRELPDGEGFPKKLSFKTIALLPSIFIVAYNFTCNLHKNKFDELKIELILSDLYQQFSKGTFREASLSIFECMGKEIKR